MLTGGIGVELIIGTGSLGIEIMPCTIGAVERSLGQGWVMAVDMGDQESSPQDRGWGQIEVPLREGAVALVMVPISDTQVGGRSVEVTVEGGLKVAEEQNTGNVLSKIAEDKAGSNWPCLFCVRQSGPLYLPVDNLHSSR